MTVFFSQLINGLSLGSIYALIALGYSMVYGIILLLNFAHGDVIMVGAYMSWFVMNQLGLGPVTAVCATIITCTLLGVVIEKVAYTPLRNAPRISLLITAIGVSFFLEYTAELVMGSGAKVIPSYYGNKTFMIGSVPLGLTSVITLVVTVLSMLVLTFLVQKTKLGKAMRAVSEDMDAARLMGINVNSTISFTFAVGSALAGIGSVLYCCSYPQATPTMGSMLGLKAFVAAVLGGIGSIPGAMIGGIAIGLCECFVSAIGLSAWKDAVTFAILIIVLLFKPTGFLGRKVQERCKEGRKMNKNRKTIKMPVRYLMNAVLVALLFVALSYLTRNILSTYQNKVLMTVGINIILAVSLNVATGYLGQLPLGHAGFMAVGAYTCALFTKFCPLPDGVSFAIGLVLACIVAGLFGVLIGIPALRLTGDYLAILTLGFGEIIRITLNNIDDVLGFKLFYGSKGLKNIPKYSNFTNVFLCVVITCFLIHAMMKSRHGRAVLAIRDNEIAAESCGIQTTYYKVMAFAFSAAFAGLAGGLYACYIGVLNPSTFGFMKSIEILVMVVLGGMGSMLGSILSATVLTILPEATRSFDSYRMVIYSLVLILMMIFRPGGLLGSYDFSMSRLVERVLFGKKKKEGADHE